MGIEYSVLMSVYYKEQPAYLRESLQSILEQTLPTNDLVLVCDGPLTVELDAVINEYQSFFNNKMRTIRLEENKGLGIALNEGLTQCRNDLVARMDTDDIARPTRCEKQVDFLADNPDVDILSASVEEFIGSINNIVACRVLPEKHKDIYNYAKTRCPFNHPCVMYRKRAVIDAGGYKDFFYLEDYYLWVRMLLKGSIGYNFREPLLWMRTSGDLYRRRGGLKYAKSLRSLYKFMKENGYLNNMQYYYMLFVRVAAALLPNSARRLLYLKVLRAEPRNLDKQY